ncbi:nascent polypeptide-associated complex protein [Candidatus Micrarchaeota archaeon]|nr:nascent polypeptide-associated complex protein [Candidatus Micrarchaeota archaeon]
MNPKQMAQMMRQFGIKSQEIPADKVIIHKTDGSTIEIREPQVVALDMQGQKSFQISGTLVEGASEPSETEESTEDNDVTLIMEQAHVSKEEAEQLLKEADGDIAAAILKAKKE